MLTILIILPLVVAALLALVMGKRSSYIKYVAIAASLLSLALIANAYLSAGQLQQFSWFNLAGYTFALTTSTMPLNMLLLLIVGIMTPLIAIYSAGYMDLPSEQQRYYFELCIFAAAMMLFAISGDLLTMFIGWELLGITSYLLIGFWYRRDGTADAARKAITTILIGDILMISAMVIIWATYHTFSFALLLSATTHSGAMAIALLLVMFAAFTKSAQFPFHEWLPDAMKGPTPVSAFLHSSTMVKAGVFLLAVLLPLFIAYHLLYLMLAFGLITAVLGVTNALAEFNIKRVLAYSTIEDLGLMFIALGTGSLVAAMMLFVAQTFYKALLFMSAGSMIKANDSEEDMCKMYGSTKYMKLFIPTAIGVASLAGLFPLSGFFGKAAVLTSSNLIVYIALLVVSFGGNIYIFRWLFLPTHKKADRKAAQVKKNYRSTPLSMMIPIYLLAAAVLAAGFFIYYGIPTYLNGYQSAPVSIGAEDIIASTIVVIIGFIVAYMLFYVRDKKSTEEHGILRKILYNNQAVNSAYAALATAVSYASKAIDSVDYAIYGLIKEGAHNVNALGNLIKKIVSGSPTVYIAAFVIGLVVVVAILIL
jgi:NADH-quinone oxidoreductase subunit L